VSLAASSAADLEQLISRLPEGLMAFDGYPGAGKSTIAKEIAANLRMECIHLDDFLTPGLGRFVSAIDISKLSAELHKRPIVVEGICMLAVMKQLSLMPDLLIYVQPDQAEAVIGESLAEEVGAYIKEFSPAKFPGVVMYYPPSVTHEESTTQFLVEGSNVPPVGAVTGEPVVINKETRILDDGRTHIDIAFIQAKTKISLALVFGGMLTLLIGLVILIYGVAGQDQALIRLPRFEVSARGIGGVIMMTSCVWAFIAYQPGKADLLSEEGIFREIQLSRPGFREASLHINHPISGGGQECASCRRRHPRKAAQKS
jgi:hypothetical protein